MGWAAVVVSLIAGLTHLRTIEGFDCEAGTEKYAALLYDEYGDGWNGETASLFLKVIARFC
jgi:hypothetical protein